MLGHGLHRATPFARQLAEVVANEAALIGGQERRVVGCGGSCPPPRRLHAGAVAALRFIVATRLPLALQA
jgi:hypothetical protein